MKIEIPTGAAYILQQLNKHGYEAYIVGGCVRDSLLGKQPNDWDITTSAKPEEVKAIFHRTIDTGIQHGTVTVLVDREILDDGSGSPASTQPVSGHVLNSYSGDELVYSKTLGDWRTHNGVDYAASRGAEVTAPAAGKVVETGTDDKWGPVVAIEDASGRIWRVCGTTDAKVKKGDTVSAGQTIGKVGSVSCECAEESHIHLEVMEGEKYLDPIKAMK
jgi:murein DD-endopeptidase MepM/ murein hydrolase activator NlpD